MSLGAAIVAPVGASAVRGTELVGHDVDGRTGLTPGPCVYGER